MRSLHGWEAIIGSSMPTNEDIYPNVTLLTRHDGNLALLTGWLVGYKHGELNGFGYRLNISVTGFGIWITEIHIACKRH